MIIIAFPIFAPNYLPHTMESRPLSFENTENAFAYKSDKELRKAKFLFSTMSYQSLVKLGTAITPWIIRSGLSVKRLVRNTIFDQFVGGEALQETAQVVDKLEKFGVNVILDYGVEGKEEKIISNIPAMSLYVWSIMLRVSLTFHLSV